MELKRFFRLRIHILVLGNALMTVASLQVSFIQTEHRCVCVWWSLPSRRIRNAHGRQQAIKLEESQVQEAKQISAEV